MARRRYSNRRSGYSARGRGRGGNRSFRRAGRSAGGQTLRIVIEQGGSTVARPGVPGMIGVGQPPAARKAKF